MAEQEQKRNVQNRFPEVPLHAIKKIQNQMAELSAGTASELMCKKEPELAKYIFTFSTRYPQQFAVEFNTGAVASWFLLNKMEGEGYSFPKVEEQTIETMNAELEQAAEQFLSLDLSSVKSSSDLVGIFLEMQRSVEFNFPTTDDYVEENRALMTLFSKLPFFVRHGAIVVYELKRRQYHSDQLSVQLGGN